MSQVHFLDPYPNNHHVILLFHGLGSNAESWVLQVPTLGAMGYRPIMIDIPGFGKSEFSGTRWRLEPVAEIILNAVPTNCPFSVMGLSMGGMFTLSIASRYPELVEKIVLINSFAALRPRSINEGVYFLRRGIRALVKDPHTQAQLVAERIFPNPEQASLRTILIDQISTADPKVYRNAMIELISSDYRKKLPLIRQPALVLTGSADTTVAPWIQAELTRGLSNAKQIIVEGGNHGMIATHPETINNALKQFLREG